MNMMVAKCICEFIGTMMLIILGDGVVANVTLNKSGMKGAGSIQITIAWGLAVLLPASFITCSLSCLTFPSVIASASSLV